MWFLKPNIAKNKAINYTLITAQIERIKKRARYISYPARFNKFILSQIMTLLVCLF